MGSSKRFVVSGENFRRSLENRNGQIVEYVVVVLFDGQPDDLPVRDGNLAVIRSEITVDALES